MSTQKDYLQATKKALGAKTWDALAEMAGVAPRALKTYRMPDNDYEVEWCRPENEWKTNFMFLPAWRRWASRASAIVTQ